MIITPENDGYEFINVYSQGKTKLGRDLSNFSHHPFVHQKYGKFNSIEGAWYYFKTGRMHENLRKLSGSKAKSVGMSYIPKEWSQEDVLTNDFKLLIQECLQCKLRQHKDLLMALISTNLPLQHLYIKGEKITNKSQHNWIIEEIDRIRVVTQKWYLKKNGNLPQSPLIF